jgi:tRNA U55 pseudouridine synthase TruB
MRESNDEAIAGKNKKKRKRNDNKRTEKKSLFDESTVPTVQCDPSTGTTSFELPLFTLNVSCGGGTYIRSLVRDIGYELDTVATMTGLVRTKQGPFLLEDALKKEDWSADKIYEAITRIE